MNDEYLISTVTLCDQYEIEVSFVDSLHQMGLLQIEIVDHNQYIRVDQISIFEKIIRLHHDLNVNLEGIDIVLNLLEKEKQLRRELNELKNRLRLYENF